MNPPFSEYEKRFLLTEVLKASNISLESLLNIIKSEQITVKWDEIFLPYGRNGRTCAEVYNTLISPLAAQFHPASGLETAGLVPIQRKRKVSATEQTPPIARELKSKPPASNGDHSPAVLPLVSTPTSGPKKRGRPSKTEIAARQAEALARGEVYPPPKPPGRKSGGGAIPLASIISGDIPKEPASLAAPDRAGEEDTASPPRKKRGRPSSVKNATEDSGESPEQLVVKEETTAAVHHQADNAALEDTTKERHDAGAAESGPTIPDSITSTNTIAG